MPQLLFEKSLTEEAFVLERLDEVLEKRRIQLVIKRLFDIFFSVVGLVLCLPVFVVISIVIKSTSRGSVFFKQLRVGRNGKTFEIFKFRTMVVNAEKKGMQITVGKDDRITKSGYFLRKYKLDELPQLINVLIGDMSFVGPRPEVPKYVKLYNEAQKEILKVRPGLTDYASIEYFEESQLLGESENPEETYINVIMIDKFNLNVKYLRRISMLEDAILISRTIKKIFVN